MEIMFVKVGREDWECYINIRHIVSFGRYESNQKCSPTTALSMNAIPQPNFVVPPAPTYEYWVTLVGDMERGNRMLLSESDYNRVVRALQSAGGDYLFE
jgi:hypothetical protein